MKDDKRFMSSKHYLNEFLGDESGLTREVQVLTELPGRMPDWAAAAEDWAARIKSDPYPEGDTGAVLVMRREKLLIIVSYSRTTGRWNWDSTISRYCPTPTHIHGIRKDHPVVDLTEFQSRFAELRKATQEALPGARGGVSDVLIWRRNATDYLLTEPWDEVERRVDQLVAEMVASQSGDRLSMLSRELEMLQRKVAAVETAIGLWRGGSEPVVSKLRVV